MRLLGALIAVSACGRLGFDPRDDATRDGPRSGPAGCVERLVPGHRFMCALRYDKSLVCWGRNVEGELGVGTQTNDEPSPVEVPPIANLAEVSPGGLHGCFMLADHTMLCAGLNSFGQRGEPGSGNAATPVPVTVAAGGAHIHSGARHTCTESGTRVTCWGCGVYLQAANCQTMITGTLEIDMPRPIVRLENRFRHACALLDDATIRCFGENLDGQVGNGTMQASVTTPVDPGVTNVDDVSVGKSHTCVVRGGQVTCWGADDHGQLGIPAATYVPAESVAGLPPVSEVAAGSRHTCARTVAGEVYCWGRGSSGEIGNGGFADQPSPTLVPLAHALQLVAGGRTNCALTDDGIYCWGVDDFGQVGNGNPLANASTPQMVPVACP